VMGTNTSDEIKDREIQTTESPELGAPSEEVSVKKQSLSDIFTIVSPPSPFLATADQPPLSPQRRC
jgi:hypothetical protein